MFVRRRGRETGLGRKKREKEKHDPVRGQLCVCVRVKQGGKTSRGGDEGKGEERGRKGEG